MKNKLQDDVNQHILHMFEETNMINLLFCFHNDLPTQLKMSATVPAIVPNI